MAVILVCLLPLIGGCDSLVSAEKRIQRAQTEFDAGDYVAAMSDVKTALSAEPDNVEGRILLSRVSLKIGDAQTARKELDSAVALGADPSALRELHYAVLLAEGRFDDVLIAAATDDDLSPVRRHALMARAELALGKPDDAETSIGRALEADPRDREAKLLEAMLEFTTGHLDEAQEKVEELLTKEPDYAEALILQGRVALTKGESARARESFEMAQEAAVTQLDVPRQLELLVALIEAELADGDTTGAGADLAQLQQRAPGAPATRYMTARLAYAKGENKAAIAELQRALGQRPDMAPARLLLGAALLADGSAGQAEAELNQLISDEPGNIEARKLLARVYLLRNDRAAASRVLKDLPETGGMDPAADWTSGTALMLAGQAEEAIEHLERAAAADPSNVRLRLDLVQAYLIAGHLDEASRTLADVPPNEGGASRRQLSILVEVAGRSRTEAKARIQQIVEDNADDPELIALAGAYLFGNEDYRGAADLFERAVKLDPDNVQARIGFARCALQTGEVDRAEEQLQRALELDSSSEAAYMGLAYVEIVKGNRAAARKWLERSIGVNPAALEPRYRLTEMALAEGDTEGAKALADQALAASDRAAQTSNRLGMIYMGASRFDEALKLFNDAAGKGDADAQVNAGIALLAQGRREEGRARLESAIKERKGWVKPLTYLVQLDSQDGRPEEALRRLERFERAGGQAVIADELRGEVYLTSNKPADALTAYKRAYASKPSSALAAKVYRAARLAGASTPDKELRDWLNRHPEDNVIRALLAEYYHQTGNRRGAIAEYERTVKDVSLPMAMNNLAWLYYEEGDSRAEDLARRAHEAAPANMLIADTYGWILTEKGSVKEGLKILEQAAKGLPDDPDVRYHYAAALARDGQKKAAADVLRSLLDDSHRFASRKDAQELLDKLGRQELGL